MNKSTHHISKLRDGSEVPDDPISKNQNLSYEPARKKWARELSEKMTNKLTEHTVA